MKYILVNIKNFIKQETTIFLLCILCIFSSAVIVNFSFGFYHHLNQKKLDDMSGVKGFTIEFVDESRSIVTKGGLVDILISIDENVLKGCKLAMEAHFQQYRSDNAAIDNTGLYVALHFMIENGRITAQPLGEVWKESGFLAEGDYFTAEQVENGEYVCIIPPQNVLGSNEEEQMWIDKFKPDLEGYCTIDDKKYKVIGVTEFALSDIPLIPITTIDDDCFVNRIYFDYDKSITRYQYNSISTAIKDAYGDVAVIPDLDIKDADSQRFYNALLILTVLLALLTGVVLAMLYEYIILQRKKRLTVYRLCGISKGKAVKMYFFECLLLTTVTYGMGVLIYEKLVLPYLSNIFEYISRSYSLRVYLVLGIIYISIVLWVLIVIIKRQIKDNIANELRGI